MNDTLDNKQKILPRSPAEWVSFSIALSILGCLVALVIYSWATHKDLPPTLSVTANSEIRKANGQFYVPFTVTNTGGETAELVTVEAQLFVDGQVSETASQEVDFLSADEIQSGAFIFNTDPNKGKLIIRVTGYQFP
jgi:uncharacterized protein (TIGR02588 family)